MPNAMQSVIKFRIDWCRYMLISLRMSFGGVPYLPESIVVVDLISDIINDSLADITWNHTKVFSDKVCSISSPIPLSKNIPYVHARDLSIYIHLEK